MAHVYGFHREAIITGCVDSFCLACEEHLTCERDVTTHISKPVHRENLLNVHYVDKYCDDHIRKVKIGYFCEFCNLLFPTATKVGLHVAEPLHVDNKATKFLKRIGNTVIALGNVSISERAWHGLMEDTCAICNVEYDDEHTHKNQPSHIIRLIQCKIQYGGNKIMFRLIDNDSCQCLTCNMVISLKMITEHFNNSDHHKFYSECLLSVSSTNTEELNDPAINKLEGKQKDLSDKEIINDININDDQEKRNDLKNQDSFRIIPDPEIINNNYESQNIEITTDENRKKILDSVNKIQKSYINIDFEFQSAFCKKCLTALDFDFGLIEEHMKEHLHKPKEMTGNALSYPSVDKKHNKTRLTQPTCDQKTSKDEESNTYKHNIRALTGPDEAKSDNCKEVDGDKHEDRDSSVSSNGCYKGSGMKSSSSNVTEEPSVSEDANNFAKRNQLSYSESCRTAYCRICDANLPATLAAMMEHVTGSAHTIRTNKTSKPKPTSRKSNNFSTQSTELIEKPKSSSRNSNHFSTQSTEDFIDTLIFVKNDLMEIERVIINRKYSLHPMSFMLVTKHHSRFRCQVCEVTFKEDDCIDHVNSSSHKKGLNKIPVITSLDTEFVREVRPGIFHCGYCHLLATDWDTLRTHMKCTEHKRSKALYKMLLDKDLREIHQEERIDRIRFFMFLRMMMDNPFF